MGRSLAPPSRLCEDEAVRTLNRRRLKEYAGDHPDAADALRAWWGATQRAEWSSFAKVRNTFPSASYVDPVIVFNIKGNEYRLVAYVDYERGLVVLKWFGSHAEYDRERWK